MEIFLDTAFVDDIEFYDEFIDGITTNPTLMSKMNVADYKAAAKELCELVDGFVSVEVLSSNYEKMLEEGRILADIADNLCVKLPCSLDGLKVCKVLSQEGIPTNMTLCFSATQALLAAKCGATYVSPFLGRIDDTGASSEELLEDICNIFRINDFETKILAASIRNIQHVIFATSIGVDAITLSPAVLKQCFAHPLTDIGLGIFEADIAKIRAKI